MALNTGAPGERISKTERESRPGQMVHLTTDSTRMERNTVMVTSNGLTDLITTENSLTTTYREEESTLGVIRESTMVCGSTTRWRVKVNSLGPMVENTLENIRTIRRKVTESSIGQMVASMTAPGLMESKMDLEHINPNQERLERGNGKMASASIG